MSYSYSSHQSTPSVLVLKFHGRNVAVGRSDCDGYDDLLAVVRHSFPALRSVPIKDIIVLAVIPAIANQGEVEISKEAWWRVKKDVSSVTISLESEMQEKVPTKFKTPTLPGYYETPELDNLGK